MDDHAIVAACAKGDSHALRSLHERHARAAYTFALRLLGNPADADDAVAEAFYEVWRSASKFANRSSVRTWILGIVRHKALDLLRARGARAEEAIEDALTDTLVDPGPTPFEWLAENQTWEMVDRCMQTLPVPQRESLHLFLLEGLSLQQIAQLQGVPDNTVATRIHHAKRKLKLCLTEALGLKKVSPKADSVL